MDHYCKNCRNVRTATRLGVVSEMTGADELFCGLCPPQVGDATIRGGSSLNGSGSTVLMPTYKTFRAEPVSLPLCNEGKGYRGMACWEPEEGRVSLDFNEAELDAILTAIRLTNRFAETNNLRVPEKLSDVFFQVNAKLGWLRGLRERAAAKREAP